MYNLVFADGGLSSGIACAMRMGTLEETSLRKNHNVQVLASCAFSGKCKSEVESPKNIAVFRIACIFKKIAIYGLRNVGSIKTKSARKIKKFGGYNAALLVSMYEVNVNKCYMTFGAVSIKDLAHSRLLLLERGLG